MVKGKGKKGFRNIGHKVKQWVAKLQNVKTESNFAMVDEEGMQTEFIGCPTFSNLKTGFTTVVTEDCKRIIKKPVGGVVPRSRVNYPSQPPHNNNDNNHEF